MGTPLTLNTVVDSSETLNVGNANLFNLSWGMIFNSNAGAAGVSADSTEQGSWSVEGLDQCWHTVTVNAHIDADWGSGPGWNWWDLRDGFASALWAVMQAVSNPTGYENYNGQLSPVVDSPLPPLCESTGEFANWGHYIPAKITIHAHNNVTGDNDAGSVTVTYSTDDQSGGSICDLITTVVESGVALWADPDTAPLAALFGVLTPVVCSEIAGS